MISRSELDKAKAAYEVSIAQLKQAQAQVTASKAQIQQKQALLQQTKLDLNRTEIRSPLNGLVIDRQVDIGKPWLPVYPRRLYSKLRKIYHK